MIPYLSCRRVHQVLDEFYDGELPVDEQIAVETHLRTCRECSVATTDLRLIGDAIRAASARRVPATQERLSGLRDAVVERVKVEFDQSMSRRIGLLFEDLHLVWPALGSCVATIACVVVVTGVLHAAQRERPDSLAGMIELLANPGSNRNPVAVDGRMLLPRAPDNVLSDAVLDGMTEEDAVFAVSAVVTREGRVTNLALLLSERGAGGQGHAGRVADLLDAVSRARFEPAQSGGSPVAVSMIWLLAHTTVRGNGRGADAVPIPWRTLDELHVAPRPDKSTVGESDLKPERPGRMMV